MDVSRVDDLVIATRKALKEAAKNKEEMGAVNWADLHVIDVEEVTSLMHPEGVSRIVVTIEEANSRELEKFLYDSLWPKFEPVEFVTEW